MYMYIKSDGIQSVMADVAFNCTFHSTGNSYEMHKATHGTLSIISKKMCVELIDRGLMP